MIRLFFRWLRESFTPKTTSHITQNEIINKAWGELHVVLEGETPTKEDYEVCLTRLNRLLTSWERKNIS